MEEFFTLDIVSTGDVCPKCICFYRKLKRLRLIGKRTSSRAIRICNHMRPSTIKD